MPKVEVKIIGWHYSTEIWESEIVEKTIITDQKGNFSTEFDAIEAVEIEISHKNYYPVNEGITLDKNHCFFSIYLIKYQNKLTE